MEMSTAAVPRTANTENLADSPASAPPNRSNESNAPWQEPENRVPFSCTRLNPRSALGITAVRPSTAPNLSSVHISTLFGSTDASIAVDNGQVMSEMPVIARQTVGTPQVSRFRCRGCKKRVNLDRKADFNGCECLCCLECVEKRAINRKDFVGHCFVVEGCKGYISRATIESLSETAQTAYNDNNWGDYVRPTVMRGPLPATARHDECSDSFTQSTDDDSNFVLDSPGQASPVQSFDSDILTEISDEEVVEAHIPTEDLLSTPARLVVAVEHNGLDGVSPLDSPTGQGLQVGETVNLLVLEAGAELVTSGDSRPDSRVSTSVHSLHELSEASRESMSTTEGTAAVPRVSRRLEPRSLLLASSVDRLASDASTIHDSGDLNGFGNNHDNATTPSSRSSCAIVSSSWTKVTLASLLSPGGSTKILTLTGTPVTCLITSLPKQDEIMPDASSSTVVMDWYNAVRGCVGEECRQISLDDLMERFPKGQFLAKGGMKKVYRVENSNGEKEVVSVMYPGGITRAEAVIGMEYAASSLVAIVVRCGLCPNFVLTCDAFTCVDAPPKGLWKDSIDEQPSVDSWPERDFSMPYHYMVTEYCNGHDAEAYIEKHGSLDPDQARAIFFQIAFALFVAKACFSMRHYDIKLQNIFLHQPENVDGDLVLRYAFGSHIYSMRTGVIAKVGDYGLVNIDPDLIGRAVTAAQFTTLEYTPMDYIIAGDAATQGYGHDCFALGLVLLHLFAGKSHVEILKDVRCPDKLMTKLKKFWGAEDTGFEVLWEAIESDAFDNKQGHLFWHNTLFHTLYQNLVLWGMPKVASQSKASKAWKIIAATLGDSSAYKEDGMRYSVRTGNNCHIARARDHLTKLSGFSLLLHLCAFDPSRRATVEDVLSSPFMANLREEGAASYAQHATVLSYLAFATGTGN